MCLWGHGGPCCTRVEPDVSADTSVSQAAPSRQATHWAGQGRGAVPGGSVTGHVGLEPGRGRPGLGGLGVREGPRGRPWAPGPPRLDSLVLGGTC